MLALAALAVAFAGPHTETLRIPSESMYPTLDIGAHVEADFDAYAHAPVRHDDIVAYHPPQATDDACARPVTSAHMCARGKEPTNTHLRFIHRVIGLPGDHLRLAAGHLIRNGRRVREPFIEPCPGGEGCTFRHAITVPAGQYYVLGDNRGSAEDSRFFGPLPKQAILARVTRCIPEPKVGCP